MSLNSHKLRKIRAKESPTTNEKRWFCNTLLPQTNGSLRKLRNLKLGREFPDEVETLFRMVCWEIDSKIPDPSRPTLFQWEELKKNGIPIRRVSPAAMELIVECQAPLWVTLWQEGTTPKFPTTHYVFPTNSLIAADVEITGMTVSFIQDEKENKLIVTAHTTERKSIFACKIFQGNEIETDIHTQSEISEGVKTIPGATDIATRLVSMAIQLLLLENTRPEFDIEEKVETHHSGSGKTTDTFYPKMIGGNLHNLTRTPSESPGENEQTDRKRPKEHWRGAHWKQVPYGPGRSLRKAKLILPCLVNPDID